MRHPVLADQVRIISASSPKSGHSSNPSLQVIPRAEHGISRRQISQGSLKVLYQLNEAGYDAFIVGGGVRDLLLGMQPKDFDIATNATPEQVKEVFRNSRIIGRRFRIVHVRFGPEIIEVSTFRAQSADNVQVVEGGLPRKSTEHDAVHSSEGMILRDNVFGTIEEDALRRDFTVNALYYTVKNFEVHDYLDSMADIDRRCLRMIGDAQQRYREDPVRVLRALRLAAKLNFTLAKETEAPLRSCAALLESVPSARLFDEFMKLFLAGHSLRTYELLSEYDVFGFLFPGTAAALKRDSGSYDTILRLAFANTDERINDGKSVTPAFLLAVILWPQVQQTYAALLKEGLSPLQAINEAGYRALSAQLPRISIPRRFSLPMREIWDLQIRMLNRKGKRAEALLAHKRFRAGYDFLLLRQAAGEELDGLAEWWTEFHEANPQRKTELQENVPGGGRLSKSRRRRVKSRRKPAGPHDSA